MNPISLPLLLSTTNQPETQWLIPNLLPQGLTFLLGQPRIGKSWLALHLALSVANGNPVLGQLPTSQADVLYIGLQDTPQRISFRVHKLLGDQPVPTNFSWLSHWNVLTPSLTDQMLALDLWLTQHPKTRLVVIDSFDLLSSSTSTQQEILHQLKRLTNYHNIAILLTSQINTRTSYNPFDELIIHSTFALADTLLVLKRERGQYDASLLLINAELPDHEFALCLPTDTMRWTLLGAASDYRLSQERQDILSLLQEYNGGPLRPREIASLLHKDTRAITKLLCDMSRASQLRLVGRGQYMTIKNNSTSIGNDGNNGNNSNESHEKIS